MKHGFRIIFFLLIAQPVIAQNVGIGTTTPNARAILDLSSVTQGLLIPRMSATERTAIAPTATEAGLMVYQTTAPGGLYSWNGSTWNRLSLLADGTTTGQTLYWNGSNWTPTTNLFNNGNFIGINNTVPNTDLHISGATAANKRIQFTHSGTGNTLLDGALIGISGTPGDAFFLQNETQPLWFGTSANERMRIDAQGRVAIGTTTPFAFSNFTVSDALGNGVAMYGESNNAGNASVYINALNATANSGIGYERGTVLKAYSGVNAADDYFLNVGALNNVIYADGASGAIGLGTSAPNTDLHLHSATAVNKRIQFTHSGTGTTLLDGLLMGISGATPDAFILQNEVQPLWFGTSGSERMRIDAQGRVAIGTTTPFTFSNFTVSDALGNGVAMYGESNNSGNASVYINALNATANSGIGFERAAVLRGYTGVNSFNDYFLNLGSFNNLIYANSTSGAVGINTGAPDATVKLDINGPVIAGANGTIVNAIIRSTQNVNLVSIAASGGVLIQNFTVANAAVGASVYISPDQALGNGLIISYARVSAANTVEVKFYNASVAVIDPPAMNFYITVIQ